MNITSHTTSKLFVKTYVHIVQVNYVQIGLTYRSRSSVFKIDLFHEINNFSHQSHHLTSRRNLRSFPGYVSYAFLFLKIKRTLLIVKNT